MHRGESQRECVFFLNAEFNICDLNPCVSSVLSVSSMVNSAIEGWRCCEGLTTEVTECTEGNRRESVYLFNAEFAEDRSGSVDNLLCVPPRPLR